MNKILAKIMLAALIFSTASMQGSRLSSLWSKHSSTILSSLYVLGAAAVTYACHKDIQEPVEKLKRQKDAYLIAKGKDSSSKNLSAQEKKRIEENDNRIKYYYSKPVDVATFLIVLGGSIKLYNAYFR